MLQDHPADVEHPPHAILSVAVLLDAVTHGLRRRAADKQLVDDELLAVERDGHRRLLGVFGVDRRVFARGRELHDTSHGHSFAVL